MERRVSEESVMSILRDLDSQGPDISTINTMVRKAKRAINMYTKDAFLLKRISVATILQCLIDIAIDDRSKQYVAYAILVAFLVQLAEVWLIYLLYPGEYVSLHSNDSCLWRS